MVPSSSMKLCGVAVGLGEGVAVGFGVGVVVGAGVEVGAGVSVGEATARISAEESAQPFSSEKE